VLPELGGARLSELRRIDVQDLADRLCAEGLDASTVRNTLMPLRAIFRRALARGEIAVNPRPGSSYRPSRGVATGSPRPPKRQRFSPRWPSATGRCGRWRCTRAFAEASCWRCAGRTST